MNKPSINNLSEILKGRNLYLIGMMGSGKSTTGKPLAEKLKYRYVDMDNVIEEVSHKSIKQIFTDDGENQFRDLENKILNEIGKLHSLVVSTGGGIVTKTENWGVLHQGIVIWLNTSQERLLSRLRKDPGSRPLIEAKQIELNIDRIIKERIKFYQEADLEILIDNENTEEVVNLIIDRLASILKN